MTRLLILILISLGFITSCEKTKVLIAQEEIVRPVRLFTVQASKAQNTLYYVARTDAVQTVDLSFQVEGTLEQLPAKEGQLVEKGGLIASLEMQDFKRAENKAQVQLKLAMQDLQRKRSLLNQQGISKSLVDEAAAAFSLGKLSLDKAREDLRDARLLAPFDAYVSRRFVDNYANVRKGEPIVRLQDLTEIYVKVSVAEDLLATVRAEHVAGIHVSFPFAPGQRYELEYRENSNEAEQVAQTYEVTFGMPRPESINLLPGMTGTVEVEMLSQATTISIPASALFATNDGNFSVWVLDENSGRVAELPVQTGPATGNLVTISSGLMGGEQILSAGVHHVQEGMRVRPID